VLCHQLGTGDVLRLCKYCVVMIPIVILSPLTALSWGENSFSLVWRVKEVFVSFMVSWRTVAPVIAMTTFLASSFNFGWKAKFSHDVFSCLD